MIKTLTAALAVVAIGGGFAPKLFGTRAYLEAPEGTGAGGAPPSGGVVGSTMSPEGLANLFGETLAKKLGDFRAEMKAEIEAARKSGNFDAYGNIIEPVGMLGSGAQIAKTPASSSAWTEADPRGLNAARYVRALAAGKGHQHVALQIAKSWYDNGRKEFDSVIKSLEVSTFSGAGALVGDDISNEFTELLRTRVALRAAGVPVVTMPKGKLSMNYQTGSATGTYVAERQNIPISQPSVARMTMSAKKLAAIVPISNDLLAMAGDNLIDSFVRNDLIQVLSLRQDLAFIRGDGSSDTPKGMRFIVPDSNVFERSGGGTTTTQTVIRDLGHAAELLESSNVPMLRPFWLFNARTKWFLMTLLDANSNHVFLDEMKGGTLMGYPFFTTNQIPNTLNDSGAGTNDESEIYLADASSLIIGVTKNLQIENFPGGAYWDGTQVISGISTDETVMRAIDEHDFGARYRGNEIAVIKGVDWKLTA